MRRRSVVPLAVAGALVAGELLAATVALLPVRRGARQPGVAEAVERAIVGELASRATLVAAERTRDALRQRRLRAPDNASADELRDVAAALGADWLVSAAVHDAPEGAVPDLTLSARLYDGRSGRVTWAGVVGRSGLDGGRLLGLGVIATVAELAPRAVAELMAPLLAEIGGRPAAAPRPSAAAGERIAVVPFGALGFAEGVEVAVQATETMRALLGEAGRTLAEPGCVAAALRGPAGVRWGELDRPAREKLRADCAATLLVTGGVERWEIGGSGVAPEPTVAVAVRLLDAASGRILWTGSLEADGWDREGWFGLGRVYSRGRHLRGLLERIVKRMLAAEGAERVMKESS